MAARMLLPSWQHYQGTQAATSANTAQPADSSIMVACFRIIAVHRTKVTISDNTDESVNLESLNVVLLK